MPSVSSVYEVAVCTMVVTFPSCSVLRAARFYAECEHGAG